MTRSDRSSDGGEEETKKNHPSSSSSSSSESDSSSSDGEQSSGSSSSKSASSSGHEKSSKMVEQLSTSSRGRPEEVRKDVKIKREPTSPDAKSRHKAKESPSRDDKTYGHRRADSGIKRERTDSPSTESKSRRHSSRRDEQRRSDRRTTDSDRRRRDRRPSPPRKRRRSRSISPSELKKSIEPIKGRVVRTSYPRHYFDRRDEQSRGADDDRRHREERTGRGSLEWSRLEDEKERRTHELHREQVKQERAAEEAEKSGDAVDNSKWGKEDRAEASDAKGEIANDDDGPPVEKEKPNFEVSGKLTADTNTFNGVVIKYNEPPEGKKPKLKWRFYPFKGEEGLPVLYVHRQSAYLIGRDRRVADIPVDHPSCSKQHAVLQYRSVPYTRDDGTKGRRIRPYVIDLASGNGTFLNNTRIESERYVELKEQDVLKFGFSTREYVLLNELSAAEAEKDEEDAPKSDDEQ